MSEDEISDIWSDTDYSSSDSELEEEVSRRATTLESRRSKQSEEEKKGEGTDAMLLNERVFT